MNPELKAWLETSPTCLARLGQTDAYILGHTVPLVGYGKLTQRQMAEGLGVSLRQVRKSQAQLRLWLWEQFKERDLRCPTCGGTGRVKAHDD